MATSGMFRMVVEPRLAAMQNIPDVAMTADRKSTRLNSSHRCISYAVFCLEKKISGQMKPQMPLGQPALAADTLDLVRAWIAAGGPERTPAEARQSISLGHPAGSTLPPKQT